MPTGFVGHGSPMLAIDPVRGAELRKWGSALPKPTGIVAITPHYRARGLKIGHLGKGKALYSFPDFMRDKLPRDLDYASPDNTELAHTVADFLAPLEPTFDESRAGFDHTTWMPLRHLFPDAPAPVVEIAMPFMGEKDLLTLGRRLSPLRHQGVFILASGSITHNLAAMTADKNASTPPRPFATAFDAWTEKTLLARDTDALVDWRKRAPFAELAHPDDGGHFRVMLIALGASSGLASFPVTGMEMGAQSKRCIELV
ncbi:MAG TPA: class III extradiol ring-cleavage dioxygenase [Polyangiaceae bacterium]